MAFDSNINNDDQQQQQQQQQQTPPMNNDSSLYQNQGYQIAPQTYQYLSLGNYPTTYTINGQQYFAVQPPPGYYVAPTPSTPIIAQRSINNNDSTCKKRQYFNPEDTVGAMIVLVCGFFLPCVWLAGIFFFKSKNPAARALGIVSTTFFFVVAILLSSLLLYIVFSPSNYTDSSDSSSWSSSSSSDSYATSGSGSSWASSSSDF